MLQQSLDDVADVQRERLILVLQRLGLALESTVVLALALAGRLELIRKTRAEPVDGRPIVVRHVGTQRSLHQIRLAEVSVESLLAQEELKALVVFHQPGIRHARLQQRLFELLQSSAAHVLRLDELDVCVGKLETQ